MTKSKQSQDTLVRERPPYTMLEDAIVDDERISRQGLIVYWVLCRHANKEGECWPGLARIVKQARYSRRAVIVAIDELVTYGYIVKEHRTKEGEPKVHLSNRYTILRQYDYQKRQPLHQGSEATTLGVVQPLHQGSATTAPELDPLNQINKEEGSGPSPSSDSPAKEPSMFAKLVKARKEHFSGLGDLQREFEKSTDELDDLNDTQRQELLDAYGRFLADNTDAWVNKVNHSFAYFWKYRDRWYAALDPRADDERKKAKLEKEYGERRREIASLVQQRLEFPDLSPEDQEKQRAASPGRKMAFETGHLAKLILHAEQIGSRLHYLGTGQHICPQCAEDYVGKVCVCGFMEAAA